MAVLSNFGIPVGSSTVQTLMPKLQYRFRVTFTNLGSATGLLVTQNVISATRPSVDHEDVTIDTYNSKIRLAGKHMWQDVTVVLRDDTNNHVILAIRDQMNKQVNYATSDVVQVQMTIRYDQATLTTNSGHSNAATTV